MDTQVNHVTGKILKKVLGETASRTRCGYQVDIVTDIPYKFNKLIKILLNSFLI